MNQLNLFDNSKTQQKQPKLTQYQMIKNHLEVFGSITPLQALKEYGCFRLSARILELRDELRIETTWCYSTNKFGNEVKFKKYSIERMVSKDLHLPLKEIYFNQILSGEKKEEYRLYNDYWKKRLIGKDYSRIIFKCGYPKKEDTGRQIVKPYLGYHIKVIKHEHFEGGKPVKVFAIKVE